MADDFFKRTYTGVSRESAGSVHRRADKALRGSGEILGFGTVDFGQPPRWNIDPVHGATWPPTAGLRTPLVPGDLRGDIKVPWEFGRLQHLTSLAQSSVLDDDPEKARSYVDLVQEWAVNNPVGMGVSWSCAMEVAIRAMNLVAGASMVWGRISQVQRHRLRGIIQAHLQYVRRHPEISDVSGNHYLVDIGVTLQLELILAQGSSTRSLRRAAKRFFAEVASQFAPEGMHFEFATNYHRYMTELVLLTLAECQRWEFPVPQEVLKTMHQAVANCRDLSDSAGLLPQIGDADSGQFLIFDDAHPNDVSFVLGLADVVLGGRGTSRSGSASWALAVPHDRAIETAEDNERSLGRTMDGFGVLAESGLHVVVRAGEAGLSGRGGHDHSDLTAPCVSWRGRQVLVDPGTFSYTYSRQRRLKEISAMSHNMVDVGGVDPSPAIEGSVMPTVSSRTVGWLSLEEGPQGKTLRTGHDGFRGIRGVDSYERTIDLDRTVRGLVFTDAFMGAGRHAVRISWHVAPWMDVDVDETSGGFYLVDRASGEGVACLRVAGKLSSRQIQEYSYCDKYGHEEPATVLTFEGMADFPFRVITRLTFGEEA